MFFITMMSGSIMTISSTSWIFAWIGLEINLLSFLPLMKSFKNKYSTEAMLKYFIIQALASSLVLTATLLFLNFKLLMSNLPLIPSFFMNSALLMKMGAAPFHFWLPEVTSGCSWIITLLILTWQKIAPMILMIYSNPSNFLLIFIILISSIIGGISGMNQTCLRKILTYSSINHISWMLAASMISLSNWILYFLIYSIINLTLIIFFNSNNIFFITQLTKIMNDNKLNKLIFSINFLSLGGLPPFLGFLPKWVTIYSLSLTQMFFLTTILILSTLISLFMYIRVIFSSTILISSESFITNKMSIYMKIPILLMNLSIFSLMIFLVIPLN
uniref:NADH-ubiquinone oxidoreductase chain 2 n=1 Tax=Scolytinae sp. BMNH 1043031 TaxID=1903795 RepID=A0A343A593_9CUCU|nr:NADH dehydrogenase subunit 2 [Scolytinae sp. BMNH 1043031]